MSLFVSWTRRQSGELSTVTLSQWRDSWNFREGMTVLVCNEVARVKRVDYDAGYLVLHRPWWWRLRRWVFGR